MPKTRTAEERSLIASVKTPFYALGWFFLVFLTYRIAVQVLWGAHSDLGPIAAVALGLAAFPALVLLAYVMFRDVRRGFLPEPDQEASCPDSTTPQ